MLTTQTIKHFKLLNKNIQHTKRMLDVFYLCFLITRITFNILIHSE